MGHEPQTKILFIRRNAETEEIFDFFETRMID